MFRGVIVGLIFCFDIWRPLTVSGTGLLAADLASVVQPMIEAHDGEVAVVIRHLETGEEFAWRDTVPQPTASLIKLPVLVTAYRMAEDAKLDLSKMLTLREEDKVPGSGILTGHFTAGLTLSIRDAARLMMRYSDNTATNLVIEQIGLPATAATMASLGLAETRLNSKVYRRETSIAPERSRQFGLGSTTAREVSTLLERIHAGTAASTESCRIMIEHLLSCEDKSMLVSRLPAGTKVAHKSGAVDETRCDAGIVFGPKGPFIVSVLTTANKDRTWSEDNRAQILIGKISRAAFDHFNPDWERISPEEPAELRLGSFGKRVEFLQRTLNARLKPSPDLGVDGDFGPATESAVRAFQDASQLPVNGLVDAVVWKALGPIVEESVVADPDVVNREVLPRQPMESLDGPPFVSCDAWVVVDASDGRTIGGQQADAPLHFASTTKIMTAWLVVRYAEQHPEVLDEILTMSVRSDETRGSTSDLRAGESLSIREALYGLMLPSGNDMSVALAEHFGPRFAAASLSSPQPDSSKSGPAIDPLELFVTAMNTEAARLGMTMTHYENPHGLTHKNHLSSAHDLAILGKTVFGSEIFRQYTSTRQRGVMVHGPGGYTRNVLWKNTNELLGTEGYDGIKTGTTDQAGACLVSTGEREGRRLIVVVLGSAASKSRYTDSRNLYRWGWNQLAKR